MSQPSVHFSADPRRACKDADIEAFFAEGNGHEANVAKAEALAICATCPAGIKAACLEHGIRFEKYGIWGGMSETERRRVRSARRRNAA